VRLPLRRPTFVAAEPCSPFAAGCHAGTKRTEGRAPAWLFAQEPKPVVKLQLLLRSGPPAVRLAANVAV